METELLAGDVALVALLDHTVAATEWGSRPNTATLWQLRDCDHDTVGYCSLGRRRAAVSHRPLCSG